MTQMVSSVTGKMEMATAMICGAMGLSVLCVQSNTTHVRKSRSSLPMSWWAAMLNERLPFIYSCMASPHTVVGEFTLWHCTYVLFVVGDQAKSSKLKVTSSLYRVCMFAFQKYQEGAEAAWPPSLFLVGLKIHHAL